MEKAQLLLKAVLEGDWDLMEQLLAQDASILENQEVSGLLLNAIIEKMVDHWFLEREDTPVQVRFHPIIRYLAEKGLNLEQRDSYGFPPLNKLAYLEGMDSTVRLLVELGANINYPAMVLEHEDLSDVEKSIVPLLFVYLEAGNDIMVDYLISKGADITIKNLEGQSFYKLAGIAVR
jgi:ankyrin repeat protein